MRGGKRRVACGLTAAVLIGASGMTGCGDPMADYGCTERDKRFA